MDERNVFVAAVNVKGSPYFILAANGEIIQQQDMTSGANYFVDLTGKITGLQEFTVYIGGFSGTLSRWTADGDVALVSASGYTGTFRFRSDIAMGGQVIGHLA